MNGRRDRIVLAGLLGGLLVLGLLLAPRGTGDLTDPRASSYLSGPDGVRALHLLALELDFSVRRQLSSWSEDDPPGLLLVVAPSEEPGPGALDALEAWVRGGGVLLHAAGSEESPIARHFGTTLESLGEEGVEATDPDGVRVAAFRRAFRDHEGFTTLLRAGEAPVVVSRAFGAGRVELWADALPLTNARLRDGDQALLVARSFALGPGEVRFDEYHHGFRGEGGPLPAALAFLGSEAGGRWVIQLAVAAFLLLLLEGHRFGAPRDPPPTTRRSPLEHVDAVSGAFQRAGARRTAARLILNGLERRLGARVGDAETVAELRRSWEGRDDVDLAALCAAADDFEKEMKGWTIER